MSFFDTANQDGYRGTIDEGSVGPRLGFQEAFSAAWDATTKAHSLLAVEQGLRAVEQDQIKKIREAGLRPPDSLDDAESSPAMTTFRQGRYSAAAQSIVEGGGWYTDEMVQHRNDHLKRLQADRPDLGLMTYDDMFKKVQDDAQAAEKRDQLPKTLGGHVGAFIGGAAGSMDPVSNPLNFSTLAIGGGTGVGRAAIQGLAQGGAEAINLAASDPENILLGHQRTPGEDLARIGMAAAGGVGGDLLFQGAGAALRKARTGKWFVDQPLPERPPVAELSREITFQGEVPPPLKPGLPLHEYPDFESFARAHGEDVSPHGKSREAVVRTALDLDHVRNELNRWDGPAPWEVKPPTDTAPFRAPEEGVQITTEGARQRYMDSLETVHDVARRNDPELFKQYDALAQTRQEARDQLAGLDRNNPEHAPADPILRRVIMRADEQMRDLAPLVTRAYAMAEKEWRSQPVDHNTLDFLKRIEEQSGFRYREPEPHQTLAEFIRPGDPEIPKLREAKSFTDWFKGSKALDPDGQPAIVYHGTVHAFDQFDTAHLGKATAAPSAKEGIFFASDTEVANSYARPYDPYHDHDDFLGRMISTVDKLTLGYYKKFNEAIVALFHGPRDPQSPNIRPAYLKMHDPLVVDFKGKDYREESYYDAIRRAKAEGKDGVIFKNTYDPGFDGVQSHPADIFVVFSPDQIKAFSERYEGAPSLTEQPMRVRDPAPQTAPRPASVDDRVPLASMEPDIDKRMHVDTDTAAERVKQNVAHTIAKLDEKVEQFTAAAEKIAKLEAREIAEKVAGLEAKLAELRKGNETLKTPELGEAIAKAEKELDELQYVTFPDGRKLHLDNDRAPFIHDDGHVEQMTVRDYLREMAKDQDALKAVTTCSRPS